MPSTPILDHSISGDPRPLVLRSVPDITSVELKDPLLEGAII